MNRFEVQLSEAVRKYAHLYNTSLKEYKDVQMANNSWKEIALQLGTDESICRKRWRYLRDKFAKAKQRITSKRSGDAGGKAPVPALYISLQWLDVHVKHRETSTNMTVTQVENVDSEPKEEPSQASGLDDTPNFSIQFPTISLEDLGSAVLRSSPSVPAVPSFQQSLTTPPASPQPCSHPPPSTSPVASGSRRRKRGTFDIESAFAALDKRRAEREAAMEAGRERREALLKQTDECGRYVLHVADFMRTLPAQLLSDFKWQLQTLMRDTELKLGQIVNSNQEI